MKLVMIIADDGLASEVESVLDRADVPGYTEFPAVAGKGTTGKKMGNRAFPGSSTLYLAGVPVDQAAAMVDELRVLREQTPNQGIKAYAFQADQIL